jgi:hypothetical protein
MTNAGIYQCFTKTKNAYSAELKWYLIDSTLAFHFPYRAETSAELAFFFGVYNIIWSTNIKYGVRHAMNECSAVQ